MAVRNRGRLGGLKKVTANLNKEIRKLEARSEAGIVAAAIFIKGKAQKEAPVDIGNLWNSAFVSFRGGVDNASPQFTGPASGKMKSDHSMITSEQRGRASVSSMLLAVVGFSAVYSVPTHENPRSGQTGGGTPGGSQRKTWAEKGKWKYLEDPLKKNTRMVLEIIRRKARIR